MEKINLLTIDQESKLTTYKDKWLNKIFKYELYNSVTKESVILKIKELYKFCNLKDPLVLLVDSPMACQIAANIIQVRAQVGDQVRDQVGDQVWEFESFSANGIAWDANWIGFYDYFDSIKIKTTENFKKYRDFLESGIWDTVMYDGAVIGCRRPKAVRRNTLNQLSSDEFPAIEWRDGFKLHYLNGVFFPEKLWTKVVSGKMPFKDILKIKDIDQRTQAMRFGDIDAFMKFTKAKKLDSQIKVNGDGFITYTLYQIPVEPSRIFTETAYFVVYDCPSTGKKYMSGVEPCKTVAEAMAWKFQIKEEEWREMIPLVHES